MQRMVVGLTVAVILLAAVTLLKLSFLASTQRRFQERLDSLETAVSLSSASSLHEKRRNRSLERSEQQHRLIGERLETVEKTLSELQDALSSVDAQKKGDDDGAAETGALVPEPGDSQVFEVTYPFLDPGQLTAEELEPYKDRMGSVLFIESHDRKLGVAELRLFGERHHSATAKERRILADCSLLARQFELEFEIAVDKMLERGLCHFFAIEAEADRFAMDLAMREIGFAKRFVPDKGYAIVNRQHLKQQYPLVEEIETKKRELSSQLLGGRSGSVGVTWFERSTKGQ